MGSENILDFRLARVRRDPVMSELLDMADVLSACAREEIESALDMMWGCVDGAATRTMKAKRKTGEVEERSIGTRPIDDRPLNA